MEGRACFGVKPVCEKVRIRDTTSLEKERGRRAGDFAINTFPGCNQTGFVALSEDQGLKFRQKVERGGVGLLVRKERKKGEKLQILQGSISIRKRKSALSRGRRKGVLSCAGDGPTAFLMWEKLEKREKQTLSHHPENRRGLPPDRGKGTVTSERVSRKKEE